MAIHRTDTVPCPSCNGPLNAATNVPGTTEGKPEPGDTTVCGYCGAPLIIEADMTMRVLKREEFMELPMGMQIAMVKAVMFVAATNSHHRKRTLH